MRCKRTEYGVFELMIFNYLMNEMTLLASDVWNERMSFTEEEQRKEKKRKNMYLKSIPFILGENTRAMALRDSSMSACVCVRLKRSELCPLHCTLWTKYKFIFVVCYDFMTTTTTTKTTPLKFIISMLHRNFKATFPFGGWHECAENLKWKFIVLLSACQAFASVWNMDVHCTALFVVQWHRSRYRMARSLSHT